LHKYRLDEQMARWMVRQSKGFLPALIGGIIIVTAFLSMWLSNTATAAMMLALVLPIVRELPEGSSSRKALILAVPLGANIGGMGTPIGSPPNAIAMEYLRSTGEGPSFAMWILIALPVMTIILTLSWFFLVHVLGAKGHVEGIACDPLHLKRSAGRITVLVVAVLTAAGWLTGGWHGWSSGTVALVPVILFFGLGLLRVADLRALSWDVLLLMGGGLCLGAVLANSGLSFWMIERLQVDQFGTFGLMVVLAVAACAISCLMSNTATANLIMPMILGFALEAKTPVFLGVAFASSLAMALPISTPPNAMVFGSGELRVRDLLLPGILVSVIGLALILTLGYWWWGVTGVR
jgi:sodium-dependent dicarboxylate transporter 2/3/5